MMTKYDVGDKVRVIDVDSIHGGRKDYYNGMETVVVGLFAGYPKLRNRSGVTGIVISPREFHAIERINDKPRKSERITALEAEVAVLKAEVEALKQAKNTTVQNVTISVPSLDAEESARKFAEGLKRLATEFSAEKPRSLTPNERRADVIKRAKAFVAEWEAKCGRKISYVVNAEKRTVVALKHRMFFGYEGGVFGRGIAKCDPDDVFNADIGKAIALGRALGVDVTEFTKAVQPTEVVVGQFVRDKKGGRFTEKLTKRYPVMDGYYGKAFKHTSGSGWVGEEQLAITDDTDAVYE